MLLCSGTGCPRKDECLRYRSRRFGRFAEFGRPPVREDGSCDHLVPLPRVSDDDVRTRAYHIWLHEGRPEGRAKEHWQQAQEGTSTEEPSPAVSCSLAELRERIRLALR